MLLSRQGFLEEVTDEAAKVCLVGGEGKRKNVSGRLHNACKGKVARACECIWKTKIIWPMLKCQVCVGTAGRETSTEIQLWS